MRLFHRQSCSLSDSMVPLHLYCPRRAAAELISQQKIDGRQSCCSAGTVEKVPSHLGEFFISMPDSGVTAAVLASQLLHNHLFPRLTIYDMLRLERLDTAFRDCLVSAADSAWKLAAANTLPPSHRLVRHGEGDAQATQAIAYRRPAGGH